MIVRGERNFEREHEHKPILDLALALSLSHLQNFQRIEWHMSQIFSLFYANQAYTTAEKKVQSTNGGRSHTNETH
jgi:hypothetical protein